MPNVSGVKSNQIVFGTDTDAISAAGTATTLVLLNSGPWVNAQTVTLTSSADNSGITFVVVGKDANGAAATSAAGIIFAGRTRVRSMTGVAGSGAGTVFIKNGSATSGQNRLILDVDNGSTIDPYIADDGILCEDGAYFASAGTAVVGLSIQFDG